jgi:glycosyltransferase involved in cell wall biosynthesis
MTSPNVLTGQEQALHAQPHAVLYMHSSDDLYGADRILLQIVTGLDKTRYRPIVVLPDDTKHIGLLSRELEAAGIEYHHLPIAVLRRRYLSASGLLFFVWRLLSGTWAAYRLARTRHVQLVHGFTLAVVAAPAVALALRLPLIMHAHEILLKPRILRKGIHFVATRAARSVICVSGPVRANILRDEPWAVDRVLVLHNGIAGPSRLTESCEELRQELAMARDLPLVGMIGRISPWKGQEIFAQAISLLRSKNIPAQFVSIGGVFDDEIHHLERLQKIVAALNIGDVFTLIGFRNDARRFMSTFDVFV